MYGIFLCSLPKLWGTICTILLSKGVLGLVVAPNQMAPLSKAVMMAAVNTVACCGVVNASVMWCVKIVK